MPKELAYDSWLQLCVALIGWDDCTPPSHLRCQRLLVLLMLFS